MDAQLTPPDPRDGQSSDLSSAAGPRRDSLSELVSKLETREGQEEAIMQIVSKRLTNDPALVERAIETFAARGWASDAAALAKDQGDLQRAAEILGAALGRQNLPGVARDPIHFQAAGIEKSLGNFRAAVDHLAAGRYYGDAARLAGDHGMAADAARLKQLIPNEPPRSFASAMSRNLRKSAAADSAPTREVEDLIAELDRELAYRDMGSSMPRDKLDYRTKESFVSAARSAARLLSAGDRTGAEKAYETAGLVPADAFLAMEEGRREDALRAFSASPAGLHSAGARLAERLGKSDAAIELWKKAGRFDLAARILEKAGDPQGALACYEAGADQRFPRPGFDSPINVSAVVWYGSRESGPSWWKGQDAWQSNLERAADISASLGQDRKAIELLERAILAATRDMTDERVTVTIEGAARAAEKLGRVEQAIDLLDLGREHAKAAKLALRYGMNERAALSLEKGGDFERASKITADPAKVSVYASLALVTKD